MFCISDELSCETEVSGPISSFRKYRNSIMRAMKNFNGRTKANNYRR